MTMKTIARAYQEKNLVGSYLTAPLRAYHNWFQNKVQFSENVYSHVPWKICHIVSGIFAYLALGVCALIGTAINLFFIPSKNGYSLCAKLDGTVGATENFCEEIRRGLMRVLSGEEAGFNTSGNTSYTYHLNQQLSFDIEDVFNEGSSRSMPFMQSNDIHIEEVDEEEEIYNLPLSGEPLQSESCLTRMESHINYIQNVVKNLSQRYSWSPEALRLKSIEGRATVIIPFPDQISLHNVNQ